MVFKSFSNLKKGFTFVEIVIVISVIAILSLLSFPYYASIRRNLALERSAAKFVQDIRRAQEMAISAQEFSGSFPKGGYGIYVNRNSTDYAIFADSNESKNCHSNCNSASSERVELISLERNVKISRISVSVVSGGATHSSTTTRAHAVFIPPNPTINFTNNGGSEFYISTGGGSELGSLLIVRISLIDDSSQYRDIKINKAGLIWVE